MCTLRVAFSAASVHRLSLTELIYRPAATDFIHLRGLRQNNLKGFDLDLPVGQLTGITGLSGAGKSSLAFETLHAEGQRRYVETFSPYTRQFMELLDRPDVDRVENIRPSIAIQQSNTVKTSRSTVGTITELCDHFKVWFPSVATLFDPANGAPITDDNPQSVWHQISREQRGESILITFPVTRRALSWPEIIQALAIGYSRALHDEQVQRLEQLTALPAETDILIAGPHPGAQRTVPLPLHRGTAAGIHPQRTYQHCKYKNPTTKLHRRSQLAADRQVFRPPAPLFRSTHRSAPAQHAAGSDG